MVYAGALQNADQDTWWNYGPYAAGVQEPLGLPVTMTDIYAYCDNGFNAGTINYRFGVYTGGSNVAPYMNSCARAWDSGQILSDSLTDGFSWQTVFSGLSVPIPADDYFFCAQKLASDSLYLYTTDVFGGNNGDLLPVIVNLTGATGWDNDPANEMPATIDSSPAYSVDEVLKMGFEVVTASGVIGIIGKLPPHVLIRR